MKITTFFLLITIMQVSSSTFAQNINLSENNASLKKILKEISSQSGYDFVITEGELKDAKPVSIKVSSAKIDDVLKQIFANQPLTYTISNNTVVVKEKEQTLANKVESLFTNITGKVTDADGKPLPGVTVAVKGTKKGTITDKDGSFAIDANKGYILVFSSIGYVSLETKATGEPINIVLKTETRALEQVIVGGNMSLTPIKADVSSITVIDSKTLDALPVTDISQIFRGLVPGTNSFSTGDNNTGNATLTIRGAGGSTGISTVAVYVDGIEYAGGSAYLSSLNKDDIDRIEIIRGPGASTLFGTGSNGGVVQIFTKNGIPNQSSISFTSSAGFIESKWVPKNPDPYQQLQSLESVSGFNNVVLTIGGYIQSHGPTLPGGGATEQALYTSLKWKVDKKLTVNFTGRFEDSRFHEARNPSYDTATHHNLNIMLYGEPAYLALGVYPTSPIDKDMIEQTDIIGANISDRTTDNWTNNFTAGYTQNGSNEVPISNTAGTLPLQSYYDVEKNHTTTVRYSNVLRIGDNKDEDFNLKITSGAEYKNYYYQSNYVQDSTSLKISNDPVDKDFAAFAQLNPSYKNVFLTAGLRYEHNNLFSDAHSLNPRLGLTTNFNIESVIVKPRISWGQGITAPSYAARYGMPLDQYGSIELPNANIKPQSQQGFDYGFELYDVNNRFKFEAVYYNNFIKNMIFYSQVPYSNPNDYAYEAINVDKVANNGVELSGEYDISKQFSIKGSYSIINSVIKDTTGASLTGAFYGQGVGDRIRNIPHHTAGLFLTYNFNKLFGKMRGDISFNVTEVDGVIALNDVKYSTDIAYGRTISNPNDFGEGYFNSNGYVFRMGLNADLYLSDNLRFFVQGANIGDSYKLEQNSNFPTYGASWMAGLKFNLAKK